MKIIPALSLFAVTLCGEMMAWADENRSPVVLELRLQGALVQGAEQTSEAKALYILSRSDDGSWRRFVAWGPDFNSLTYLGVFHRFDSAKDGGALHVEAAVHVPSDPWVKGGRGRYRITLEKQTDNTYRGTYQGAFNGIPLEGAAEARFEAWPAPSPSFRPVEPGEHPRLLFRAGDLPALREKAATPFGKACLERMKDSAVGLGMLWQLTGEREYAEKARKAVEAHMADNENGDKAIRCRFVAWRLEQVAMAYDLCYRAWPPDFRSKVVEYMLAVMYCMNYARGQWTEYISWNPWSETTSSIYYAGGLAGLAMYGDPGPMPAAPTEPPRRDAPGESIAPDAGLDGDESAPVSWLADGEMPENWLYIGPFKGPGDADYLAPWGGMAKARPHAGDKVTIADEQRIARPLSNNPGGGIVSNKYTKDQPAISVTEAGSRTMESVNYFYTVLHNTTARWVRFHSGHQGALAMLNGARIRDGDILTVS